MQKFKISSFKLEAEENTEMTLLFTSLVHWCLKAHYDWWTPCLVQVVLKILNVKRFDDTSCHTVSDILGCDKCMKKIPHGLLIKGPDDVNLL